jgi:hypothetical protein
MIKKDFNRVLDHYMTTETMLPSDYEELDTVQEMVIQEIKRSFDRIKRKETGQEPLIDPSDGRDLSNAPW